MRVLLENREILIPLNAPFIEKIDYDKKMILIQLISGM